MEAPIRKRYAVVGAAVSAAAAAISIATASGDAASETRVHKVSAFDRLPNAAGVAPEAREWATRLAARGRVGEPVHRLRSAVGQSRTDVYAVRLRAGGICLLYVGFAGNCSNPDHFRRTGIQWLVGAGILVALVSDDVTDVTLTIDGRSYDVSLANNVGFAEYEAGEEATITVVYTSGAAEATTIRLNGPPPSAPG
jgi:hypothetical protein